MRWPLNSLETEMNRPLIEDPVRYRAFADKIPLGRWGRLPEIAYPLLFLASEASSFMTGEPCSRWMADRQRSDDFVTEFCDRVIR